MPIAAPSPKVITRVIRQFQADPTLFRAAEILPLNSNDYNNSGETIEWDVLGPIKGMTHAYVPGTDPRLVEHRKLEEKSAKTAWWMESGRITERDVLKARRPGAVDQLWANGLYMSRLEQANLRLDTRIEYLRWLALTTGALNINEDGIVRNIDYGVPASHKVNVSTAVGFGGAYWSNLAGADVIGDLQAAMKLFRGTGVVSVRGFCTSDCAKLMAGNDAFRDLVRQSSAVLNLGLENVGQLVTQLVGSGYGARFEGIELYDQGYTDEADTFQPFIPDNKLVLIGRGAPALGPLGEFASTPSIHNGGIENPTGGKIGFVDDNGLFALLNGGAGIVDRVGKAKAHADVVAGIYGLPVMFHPEWIVILTIAA